MDNIVYRTVQAPRYSKFAALLVIAVEKKKRTHKVYSRVSLFSSLPAVSSAERT